MKAITESSMGQALQEWHRIRRTNEGELLAAFNENGNHFYLDSSIVDTNRGLLHIYIGIDAGKLFAYTILAKDDTIPLKANLLPIAFSNTVKTVKIHKNGSQQLEESINSWANAEERSMWVRTHFQYDEILQMFIIDTSDFVAGANHICFFALTEDNNIDLVVASESNGEITGFVNEIFQNRLKTEKEKGVGETTSYHDMARPVPPFGGVSVGGFGVWRLFNL